MKPVRLIYPLLIWLALSLACAGVTATPNDFPTRPPTFSSDIPTPSGMETAKVARVIDGDTIELTDGRRVRYIGINTPEHDQPYYEEAVAANRQLVEGKTIQLEKDVETVDQYGRTLAYIWVEGQMANLEIVSGGYANAYTVPPNVKYEAEFRQAEQEAREAGRGLWVESGVALKIIRIQADAPGSDNENPNGEWLEIANQGSQPVKMRGFSLKDQANHIYTFGDFTAAPGASFKLYSGQGQDSETALYWGMVDESVWNNDSDSAFLRDAQGALVDTYAY